MDISEVVPGLFIGSSFYPPDRFFDVVFDFEGDYAGSCDILIRAPFLDGPEVPDWLVPLADMGSELPGEHLAYCKAGRNRSALFAALYLQMMAPSSAEEALELVRKARAPVLAALTNMAFVDYLLS